MNFLYLDIETNSHKKKTIHEVLSFLALLVLFLYLFGSLFLSNIGTDGTCYALLGRNLAEGFGSIWQPAYSFTQHTPFYEHPSLGLFFNSLFFRVLGDHIYTEHVYAFITASINLCFIFLFWQKFYCEKESKMPSFSYVWIIIACWFCVPYFVYYYIGGGLEMLANAFALPAVYLLLNSIKQKLLTRKALVLTFYSALLVFVSFMINGPLTLFPLFFYILHWFVYKKFELSYYLKLTFFLLFNFIIIATCFFLLLPESYTNFTKYLEQSVLSSLTASRYDATFIGAERLQIISIFLAQFKGLLLLSLILLYLAYIKGRSFFYMIMTKYVFENKSAHFLFLMSISATLPIISSSKQSLHYTLQGGFFFLIAFLLFIVPMLNVHLNNIELTIKKYRCLQVFVLVSVLFILSWNPHFMVVRANDLYDLLTYKMSFPSRRTYLMDAKKIALIVPKKSIISYSLISDTTNPEPVGNNLMRYFKISISPDEGAAYSIVSKKDYLKFPSYRNYVNQVTKEYSYKKLPILLNHFYLYKKQT